MFMVTLNTGRLILREFTTEDFDAVHKYATDPEVYKYQPWGPNTVDDTKDFIQGAISRRLKSPRVDYELAVEHPEVGLIGGCGIYGFEVWKAEIGYTLRRDMWGKGYGTEVVATLIHFGFHQLGLHRVEASCDTRNIASYRVMEKNGMLREGTLRENKKIHGEWRSSYIYSILEREFWDKKG